MRGMLSTAIALQVVFALSSLANGQGSPILFGDWEDPMPAEDIAPEFSSALQTALGSLPANTWPSYFDPNTHIKFCRWKGLGTIFLGMPGRSACSSDPTEIFILLYPDEIRSLFRRRWPQIDQSVLAIYIARILIHERTIHLPPEDGAGNPTGPPLEPWDECDHAADAADYAIEELLPNVICPLIQAAGCTLPLPAADEEKRKQLCRFYNKIWNTVRRVSRDEDLSCPDTPNMLKMKQPPLCECAGEPVIKVIACDPPIH